MDDFERLIKGTALRRLLMPLALILIVATLGAGAPAASMAEPGDKAGAPGTRDLSFQSIRTDSPRDTLESFLRTSGELSDAILQYRSKKSVELAQHIAVLSGQVVALIDMSAVPSASRRERGAETAMVLLDVFGRIEPPVLEEVPDVKAIANDEGPVVWHVPNTLIKIAPIEEGPRKGEFLFGADTVRAAPRFFRGIEDRPLTPRMPFDTWTDMSRQITGPLIPAWLVQAVPKPLMSTWLDTPAWKVLLMISVYAVALLLAILLHRLLRRIEPADRLNRLLLRMVMPIAVLAAVTWPILTISRNLNLSGSAAYIDEFTQTILIYVAWAWLSWLFVRAVFEAVIRSPQISDESYDANMLRLVSSILGVIGIILILGVGGHELGLPVMSILAGFGIGGLAVALAIRPTLENLIGGFTLYFDKPVRVGDFCTFGGQTGTIEKIGIRSTQIRAMDRTLISVPNAQFADMQLVNWARCDQMLINEVIGVRYETTPDQLRFVLAKIREMLHSHPRIDPHTVRVRFAGYGDSSLNIDLRVYARTREWNDFFAIREDVFLRIYDIVTGAGTSFAFPSRTLYLGRDDGLDESARHTAEQHVREWRRSGRLPFPRFSEKQQEALEGGLDYPPRGSYEAGGEHLEAASGSERLSKEVDESDDKRDKQTPT